MFITEPVIVCLGTKTLVVHGQNECDIPTQLPVHEDTQFEALLKVIVISVDLFNMDMLLNDVALLYFNNLTTFSPLFCLMSSCQECLEFFNIPEARSANYFLMDKRWNLIHYAKVGYSFRTDLDISKDTYWIFLVANTRMFVFWLKFGMHLYIRPMCETSTLSEDQCLLSSTWFICFQRRVKSSFRNRCALWISVKGESVFAEPFNGSHNGICVRSRSL